MFGNKTWLRFRWEDLGLYLLLVACWAIDASQQVVKYFSRYSVPVFLAGALAIAAVMVALRWAQSKTGKQLHWGWLAAFWVVMAAIYLVLYPMARRHYPGSDSEDALRIASSQLLQLRFPYCRLTYLGNPITPMPGALLLAIPFQLLGRASLQNPIWLATFVAFCLRYFRDRATALAYLIVIVFAGAGTLDDFVVGADYSINCLYICVAVYLFLQTYAGDRLGWKHLLAGILLGVSLSSRSVYAVIPPLAFAYLLQQGRGTIAALRSIAVPVVVAAAVTIPVFLWDPSHFTPLQIATKLNMISLPGETRRLMLLGLPVLAILTSCLGFFVRLTLPRLFLLAGIALSIVVLPPGFIGAAQNPTFWGLSLLYYGGAGAILVGLWAFHRFEEPAREATAA